MVPPPPPPPPPKPTFDQTMWDQLVYDAYEEGYPDQVSWMLNEHPVNIRVITTEEDGTVSITPSMVREIEAAFRSVDAWLTERRFFGRLASGPRDPDPGNTTRGWITVTPRYSRLSKATRESTRICGVAYIGQQPGRIWLYMDKFATQSCTLHETMLHEIGHALGFYHVDGTRYPDAMMGVFTDASGVTWSTSAPDFSPDERYHMRLAYRRLRRWQSYCPTPLTGCNSSGGGSFLRGPGRVIQ